ncbi:hypothetical protein HK097_004735, partial [Rhizophlyctis rosea]
RDALGRKTTKALPLPSSTRSSVPAYSTPRFCPKKLPLISGLILTLGAGGELLATTPTTPNPVKSAPTSTATAATAHSAASRTSVKNATPPVTPPRNATKTSSLSGPPPTTTL